MADQQRKSSNLIYRRFVYYTELNFMEVLIVFGLANAAVSIRSDLKIVIKKKHMQINERNADFVILLRSQL